MPRNPALLPPDAGPSSEPSEPCRGTVAYLFLLPGTVREPFALPQTWGEYFAGCEEGEATVHLHAQGANDGSWLGGVRVGGDSSGRARAELARDAPRRARARPSRRGPLRAEVLPLVRPDARNRNGARMAGALTDVFISI